MKKTLKDAKIWIRQFPPTAYILDRIALWKWQNDKPAHTTPHIVKRRMLIGTAKRYEIPRLIETGTYLGDMVRAAKSSFERIDSIELSKELYGNAARRFRNDKNVRIWNGDSALLMPEIIAAAGAPIIFWLDAHYSGGITARSDAKYTPIEKELEEIFKKWDPRNIVMIDDARLFIGADDYPTIQRLNEAIAAKSLNLHLEIKDDIITIKDKDI